MDWAVASELSVRRIAAARKDSRFFAFAGTGPNVATAYEAALSANNKKYTIYVYPGTQHAFNNDTGAARYNKAAADLAWSRTLAFFSENLGAPPKAA